MCALTVLFPGACVDFRGWEWWCVLSEGIWEGLMSLGWCWMRVICWVCVLQTSDDLVCAVGDGHGCRVKGLVVECVGFDMWMDGFPVMYVRRRGCGFVGIVIYVGEVDWWGENVEVLRLASLSAVIDVCVWGRECWVCMWTCWWRSTALYEVNVECCLVSEFDSYRACDHDPACVIVCGI